MGSLRQKVFDYLDSQKILNIPQGLVKQMFKLYSTNSVLTYLGQWKKQFQAKERPFQKVENDILSSISASKSLKSKGGRPRKNPKSVIVPEEKTSTFDIHNIPDDFKFAIDLMEYAKEREIDVRLNEVKAFVNVSKASIPFMDLEPYHEENGVREYLLDSESRQRKMYIDLKEGKHTFAVGVRGTAKTFTVKQFFAKELATKPNYELHMFCGKVDTAKANLREIKDWLYERGLPETVIETDNAHTLKLNNGSYIRAHANTQADIRKYRGKINWVDEAQLMEKSAFAAMLGLFSGVNDFQLILTGNYGEISGCPFENFCRAADREDICKELNISFYEFGEQDIHWTTDDSKKGLRKLMDACIGIDGTATQLDQTWVTPEGAIYDSKWISDAFTEIDFPIRMKKIIGGMDWGDGSQTTLVVVGLGIDNHLYILYLWSKKNATTDDVVFQILKTHTEFGLEFAWEASPSGDFARKSIREKYGNMITFYDSYFTSNKPAFIFNISHTLGARLLHFIDSQRDDYSKEDYKELRDMRAELERYCGDKKMDHLHDGMAHAIMKLVKQYNLIEFITKSFNIYNKKVQVTT